MKISSGNPITETRGGKKYPWDNMRVGDSFDVPSTKPRPSLADSIRNSARHAGMKASVRYIKELKIYRAWRVE
jgi:hypothetical protein